MYVASPVLVANMAQHKQHSNVPYFEYPVVTVLRRYPLIPCQAMPSAPESRKRLVALHTWIQDAPP